MILPIDKFKKEIITTIENNIVTIITGKTGCGKSTMVPQYVLDNLLKSEGDKVLCCTPTRISAFSLAKYVARTRNTPLGKEIGYAIGGERESSFLSTPVEYQTIGVLKEMLLHRTIEKIFGKRDAVLYVIIDEIHERGIDQDTTLFLLRRYIRSAKVKLRVVLMSATIDPRLFQNYFKGLNGKVKSSKEIRYLDDVGDLPRVINIPTRTFKVSKYYLNNIISKHKQFQYLMQYFEWTSVNYHDMLQKVYEVGTTIVQEIHEKEPVDKTILVFLPGISEIIQFEKEIFKNSQIDNKRIKVYILHSCVSIHEQKRVFDKIENCRKIILSTNISESSITVPTVSFVIDFCFFKEMNLNYRNGSEELVLKYASKENLRRPS